MSEAEARAETEIRGLIEDWAKAVRARDIDKVVAFHTDDMVMFDVPPPVAVRGIDGYRETWPQFFEWQRKVDGSFEIASLEVTAGDDVAWAYLLVGGGYPIWEEAIESLVNPRQSEMKQMIEPRFTPAHTHPFEALLNQPFTGTFH